MKQSSIQGMRRRTKKAQHRGNFQASKGVQSAPRRAGSRLTTIGGTLALALSLVGGGLVATMAIEHSLAVSRAAARHQVQDEAAGDQHTHGAAALTRTVAGPLWGASPDAGVRLEVGLSLDEHDPRARGPVPRGIPAGEKVLLTFHLSEPQTGRPLSGEAPTADLKADDVVSTSVSYQPEAGDPFEVRELFSLVGQSGELGVIEVEGNGQHTHSPGTQPGRSSGTSPSGTLKLPGQSPEAVADPAGRYIFASLPKQDMVAIVDALNRQLFHTVNVGRGPSHIASEPSGKRIWVANDADGTVTAIDSGVHGTRSIAVGAGHHEFAFSEDSRLVFVSSTEAGTVSAIDAEQGRVVAVAPVGTAPHGIDYAAGRLYVANEGSGNVSVLAVEGDQLTPLTTIEAGEGTRQVRIDPSGRVGVASNTRANTLTIFSVPSHKVLTTVRTGAGPDGIVFLEDYALVRNRRSADVTFVNLANPEIADEIQVGSERLLDEPGPGVDARLFLDATGEEVLVPDPASNRVERIHVMHGRPMAMGQIKVNQGTDFLLALRNRVKEIAPGTYQRVVRFDREGSHTLTIGLGPDKQAVPFTLNVVSAAAEKAWAIQPLEPGTPYVAGQEGVVQVRVTNQRTGAAEESLRDGVITVYRLTPGRGIWQRVLPAEHVGNGVYQARVVFPEASTFSMSFNSQQLALSPGDSPRATLEVVNS